MPNKTVQLVASMLTATCNAGVKKFRFDKNFASIAEVLAEWLNYISGSKILCIIAQYLPIKKTSILRELEERCRIAEARNTSNSLFFAKTCHELRSPLTAILGISEIILENPQNSKCMELVQKINKSGNSLLRTLNDVLDISKLEAGKFNFQRVAFSPETVVSQTVDLFGALACRKRVGICFQVASNYDGIRQGDSHRLGQVLNNIIGNSIKFTANGNISILVENYFEQPLKISVRDTGVGMSDEQLNRICDEYEQFDSNLECCLEGTGLGMSIVHAFVSQMGGEISISSVLGEGTLTQILLPLPSLEDAAYFESSSKSCNDEHTNKLSGLRVLVVDDCVLNSEILSSFLKDAGVDVTIVQSGLKAVEICSRLNFDAVFLDINLQDLNGVMVQSEIFQVRKISDMPQMKYIAFTANAGSEDVEHYLNIGFDSHFGKPFRKSDLLKDLSRIMAL